MLYARISSCSVGRTADGRTEGRGQLLMPSAVRWPSNNVYHKCESDGATLLITGDG